VQNRNKRATVSNRCASISIASCRLGIAPAHSIKRETILTVLLRSLDLRKYCGLKKMKSIDGLPTGFDPDSMAPRG
jgi:hypothetical protein